MKNKFEARLPLKRVEVTLGSPIRPNRPRNKGFRGIRPLKSFSAKACSRGRLARFHKPLNDRIQGETGMRMTREIIGLAVVLVLSGTLFNATAQTAKAKNGTPASPQQAYCTSTGGKLETRVAVYGTNGPVQDWLQLAGIQDFCQYTLSSDGSRIHVSLATLYTVKPSLAALAYYAQTPWNGQGDGNPASFYCTQLGGSDSFGGVTAAGGGWVELNTIDEVLEACIFPDNSTIDSWGLFYHSDGIIRGIDLSTVLKYSNPYTAGTAKSGKQ